MLTESVVTLRPHIFNCQKTTHHHTTGIRNDSTDLSLITKEVTLYDRPDSLYESKSPSP